MKYLSSIWGIFIIFLLLHIYPYLNNPVPTGYDAGIYLYLFKVFPNVPIWLTAGFAPALFALLYPVIKLGVNPEYLLIPLSIFSQIVVFFSLYIVVKKMAGEKTALWTVFFFIVSLIQFRTFWFYYVNNTFALAFLLFSFYFLSKKNFIYSLIFAVVLGFFHLPTFLIYCISLIILLFFDRKNLIFYLKVFCAVIFIFLIYYLPTFDKTILPLLIPVMKSIAPYKLITTGTISTGGGTFYDLPLSLLMTILYLPFSCVGFYLMRKKEQFRPFLVGSVVLFLIVFTGFFFSRRYFIPFDLFLVFFAGIGFTHLLHEYSKNESIYDLLKFYPVILLIFIIGFVYKTAQPLITKNELSEIKQFGKQYKNAYVLSTDKSDTAWLLGYTDDRIIAWGYGGEDKYWDYKDWEQFFMPVKDIKPKLKLLKKLPQPLYIYINDKTTLQLEDIINNKEIKQVSPHIYLYRTGS